MPQDTPFTRRLAKNFRHFKKWAQRRDLSAFRVYDRDLPEVPFVVEWFDGRVHLVEFARRRATEAQTAEQRAQVLESVKETLQVSEDRVFTKTHLPMAWGKAQYGREGEGGTRFPVREQGLQFLVNLSDYLDTGLFLDHRTTRARIRDEAKGKRFLNLFCYTGSFTVYAAAGGARSTTSVDLSNTYLDWAQENLALNHLSGRQHVLQRSDATRWLSDHAGAGGHEAYDLIVLDPPSFSASKKMERSFNVQRDQRPLLEDTFSLLAPGGTLYFSTNFRGFELSVDLGAEVWELTPRSLPEDFHDREIHRCWRIMKPA